MEVEPYTPDDEWIPAVDFKDFWGSPLLGTISLPLPSFLSADRALEMAEAADRLISWATAMRFRALGRVEEAIAEEPIERRAGQPERLGGDEAHALAVAEVATGCAVSESAAARDLHDAAALLGDQWAVLDALESTDISPAHARVILDQARTVPAEYAGKFSRTALTRIRTRQGRRTPSELRTCLRRLREQLHPETLEARKAAAHAERGVWFSPEPDGMCTLAARLPAETGLAIFNGLDQDARTAAAHTAEVGTRSDPFTALELRTLPQLRADALAARLLGTPDEAVNGSFRPEVVVTIPIGLALRPGQPSAMAENGSTTAAELEGYGPIDAPTALRLAAIAPTWHRLFIDPLTGAALGVGRTAYRPPQALRHYLAHRDGRCRFPGCTRSAAACEPDHTTEWQDGGTTDPDNLALLCRKHHALKSIGAWNYSHAEEGHLTWRSPLGRTHCSEPADRGRPRYALGPPEPPDIPRPPDDPEPDHPDPETDSGTGDAPLPF
ncbi:DUF222 domain-containing protein [Sinomonas sp. JGH33]|uniref:DUF222 domain-containing protein n=1 Tax=Sinomonas terricola TaxID=3110330 RepID=A0ABU5T4L7_9MICC|nr:DUF222 domain-containing protein [Sinomonas sp. JGH33]MEA5454605.1 DUF222 domain-containing protein [Sinomonas sp. JGH33]